MKTRSLPLIMKNCFARAVLSLKRQMVLTTRMGNLVFRQTVSRTQCLAKNVKILTTRMGFEPTRAEHIGLAVQRLNHSATSSVLNS